MACWNFEGDAHDQIGGLDGELVGGAVVRNGRLVLNGQDAYVRTAPLGKAIRARSLEAWVRLDNTEQRGGGVVSIESERGDVFDGIVFGEKEPREWISGSDFHRRTKDVGGPVEMAPKDQFVHLAITYGADNLVTLYRNGVPYGQPYKAEAEIQTYGPVALTFCWASGIWEVGTLCWLGRSTKPASMIGRCRPQKWPLLSWLAPLPCLKKNSRQPCRMRRGRSSRGLGRPSSSQRRRMRRTQPAMLGGMRSPVRRRMRATPSIPCQS
ncbi:LamG-like jellyroll fold domain-containing protein [Verrucomicrobium spinosum]|uniref:LamG-like jellyroll fold domain-containing protein n=1 Tax=Verrucomicrobium spinosum TaxID=2736 RepID=UPI0009E80030